MNLVDGSSVKLITPDGTMVIQPCVSEDILLAQETQEDGYERRNGQFRVFESTLRRTSIMLVEQFGSDGKPRRRESQTARKGLQKPQNSGD